ncbi:MAG: twin-arginine translocation signal domain-containing protein [Desulfarculaceae bacterium]|nr:twin-arginine translocation signal domain-containing protein [Desulfarculaceae bacterium]MCF8074180.1 twin-arginine translocation signal domain-containing protein [Desulfarculaceae bacterium]MCF8102761.1 twin-arginine translocation signal domain-containing protein [Desulfarculaceae bacterium]MCF8116384.1 twin-arginine translocation signal domain-containing protein [Desulfarculaceae bacterium]
MGKINRRNFIKNVAIGGAVLGLGNAVFTQVPKAWASGQGNKEESTPGERRPEIITSCHCKKVVLKLIGLDPRFTVCHCDTCQLIHNGPWYGANCSDLKIIDGKQYITEFIKEHGGGDKSPTMPKGWAAWHFCSNCGSRLYYSFDDKILKNVNDKYNVSAGLLNPVCGDYLMMENELFFDMKPAYYSFHETKKLSSGEALKTFKM